MDSNTFMGLFIGAVLALLGGAAIIAKIVVSPVIKLNTDIKALQVTLTNASEKDKEFEEHMKEQNLKIDSMGNKIEQIDKRVVKLETKAEVSRRA